MEELFLYLCSIHPLTKELKSHLLSVLKVEYIPKKEYLLKTGQVCKRICFVKSGLIRCFYNRGDLEISSWFMKEGDVIVSVESFFQQKSSYESIQALENSEVFYITYNELQLIYRQFPEFNFIGRVLTEKYYTLSEQRLYSLRMQRSQERYEYMLEHHSDLILRVPAKFLASYLGVTEVTLSKIKSRR